MDALCVQEVWGCSTAKSIAAKKIKFSPSYSIGSGGSGQRERTLSMIGEAAMGGQAVSVLYLVILGNRSSKHLV